MQFAVQVIQMVKLSSFFPKKHQKRRIFIIVSFDLYGGDFFWLDDQNFFYKLIKQMFVSSLHENDWMPSDVELDVRKNWNGMFFTEIQVLLTVEFGKWYSGVSFFPFQCELPEKFVNNDAVLALW